MKKFSLTDLIIFIVSTELTGAVSALISGGYSAFYRQLIRPPFSPPGAVFPVVWVLLYAGMGFSAYLIYRDDDKDAERRVALGLYVIQLAVNFSWSIIFFRSGSLPGGVIAAILLFIAIAAMMLSFRKVNKLAALINIPYLLWSAFAVYLSVGIWILN